MLHVSRVEFADYPSCKRLRTMSKDELSSCFYETPSSWGDRQNTLYSGFAKSPRFLNKVITFVLHPLSYYNSITKPCARFLLSLLKGLTIDFLSHLILFLIDIYRNMMTCDKLIFPLAIMRILCHFSISYSESTHFSTMCAIDAATVRRSEAQLRLKQSQIEMATPLTFSAPSSLAGVVTLEAVMVQLQCMDARLNTLCNELCQVNTHVGRIAQ